MIDGTKYIKNTFDSTIENGDIDGYYKSDYVLGNFHEVENLQDYVNYMLTNFNYTPSIVSIYTAGNCLPIASYKTESSIELLLPKSYEDKITVLFDRKNDGIKYSFVPAPNIYPEVWEPYNTRF